VNLFRDYYKIFSLLVIIVFASSCDKSPKSSAAYSDIPSGYINPENDLEKALVLSSLGRSGPGEGFINALVHSRVYIRVPKESLTERGYIRDRSRISYLTLNVKGRDAMALYTSEKRLTQRFGSVPYIYMDGEVALELAKGLPIVVNSGLNPSAFIRSDEVENILRMRRPQKAV
jgi:hypothetical protein